MFHSHNLTVIGYCRYLQFLRHGFPDCRQGMVSAYRNLFRKSGKQDAVLAAGSLGYLAVHQLLRIGNLSPVSLADGLMTEAYAEHRNLLSQFLHHINADARILRPPRSGERMMASGFMASSSSTVIRSFRMT